MGLGTRESVIERVFAIRIYLLIARYYTEFRFCHF
jgi:hypothetical protein